MIYTALPVTQMNPHEYKACLSLCFRRHGDLEEYLRACRRPYENVWGKVVMAWEHGRLQGWVLVYQDFRYAGATPPYSLNIYVRKEARRRGIGRALVNEVKKVYDTDRWETFPWDDRSESFFKSVGLPD